jgi:hypothetical protein
MPTNDWAQGALYPLNGGLGGFWKQPVPGGIVYPQQATGVDYFSTKPFSELTGVFNSLCGHSLNYPLIQREYDYDTSSSVALVCCCLCGVVNWTIEPFEAILDTVYIPTTVV